MLLIWHIVSLQDSVSWPTLSSCWYLFWKWKIQLGISPPANTSICPTSDLLEKHFKNFHVLRLVPYSCQCNDTLYSLLRKTKAISRSSLAIFFMHVCMYLSIYFTYAVYVLYIWCKYSYIYIQTGILLSNANLKKTLRWHCKFNYLHSLCYREIKDFLEILDRRYMLFFLPQQFSGFHIC